MKAKLKQRSRIVRRTDGRKGYWDKVSEIEMLDLFAQASRRVPAYKKYLKDQGVRVSSVKTIEDFKKLPYTDKNSYLKKYSPDELVWDGDLKRPYTIHSTSGTTGEPTYFFRDRSADDKRKYILDGFLRASSVTLKGPTLFIITFGMGIWSAGLGIYTAAYLATNSGKYPISIISPGVNKVEVLKILRTIAKNYSQVVIAGYPPFVKDVIDDAVDEHIDLRRLKLRLIFTGEAYSEEFRDYLVNKAEIDNVYVDTMNTYGTAELGPVAVETPFSILVRRLTSGKHFSNFYGEISKSPTLAQYLPRFTNFECIDNELFFTGNNTIPLIRYRSGDHGGVLSYEQTEDKLSAYSVDLASEIQKAHIAKFVTRRPLVYVYERKNLAVTLYGILIYPEYIRPALLSPNVHNQLTGKFTLIQRYDEHQRQYIEINLELRKNASESSHLKDTALKLIVNQLLSRSSEFGELSRNLGASVYPKLVFWAYEHPTHFAIGNKQQWIKSS